MKLRNVLFVSCAAASLAVAGCTKTEDGDTDDTVVAETEEVKWGYGEDNGPDKWGSLSEANATCDTGKEQSPIDLPAADKAKIISVSTNYGAAAADVEDTGLGVKVSFGEGFTLTSGDNTYKLLQFHYHTPSENTIDGKAFPLTAHFVHSDDDGNLAVLGVMFEEGAANPEVQKTIDNVGKSANLNLVAFMPGALDVYNFKGSLTTPPCSEGVNWHVLTKPVTASKEQIDALTKLQGNNARPVQPLNDREI